MTASPLTESRAPVGSSASIDAAIADDRPRDRDPLPLTAGQIVRIAAGLIGEPEVLQDGQPGLAGRPHADAVEFEGKRDVLHGGQPGEQVEVLEDVADRAATQPRPIVVRHARQRGPADHHLATAGLLQTAGDRQQRALARPARPHDGDQLPDADRQVDVAKRVHLAGAGSVHPRDLPKLQRGGHVGPPTGSGLRVAPAAPALGVAAVGGPLAQPGLGRVEPPHDGSPAGTARRRRPTAG